MGLFTDYSDEYYKLKRECEIYEELIKKLQNCLNSIKLNIDYLDDPLKRLKDSKVMTTTVYGRPKDSYNTNHDYICNRIDTSIRLYKDMKNNIQAQLEMAKELSKYSNIQKNSEKRRCEKEEKK